MAKKLVSGLVLMFFCFLVSGITYKQANADVQKVTVVADKATASVAVTINDAALEGKEVSVVCYDPQWNGTYSDWTKNSGNIVYLGQVKVSGVTSIKFQLNAKVLSGNYSLVTGSGNGRNVTMFTFDQATVPVITTTAAPVITAQKLTVPTSVKAAQSGATKVKVSWNSVSGATGYSVYRSLKADTGYMKLGDTAVNSYVDKKAAAGKTYFYKVTANGASAAVTSDQSAYAKASTMKAPAAKLKAAKKKINVSWKKIGGVKGYKVYISNKKNGKYKLKVTVKGAAKVKATIKKLKKGKTYFVKVCAYKKIDGKAVSGKFSAVKSVKVK